MNSKLLTLILILTSLTAYGGNEREQSKRLYSSLTGGTANKAIADKYEAKLISDGPLAAAEEIIESGQGFYSATLRNFFSPTTNENGSQFVDFNDMTATLIGMTRDSDGTTVYPGTSTKIRFFDVFYKNIMYQYDARDLSGRDSTAFTLVREDVSKSSGWEMPVRFCASSFIKPGAEAVSANCISREYARDEFKARDHIYFPEYGVAVPEYNRTKNYHHKKLQEFNLPYNRKDLFVNRGQVPYTTIYDDAVAGVFSTRAFAVAYYKGGTNRTPFKFFARNFLCLEMEQLNDTSIPDVYVRRDVDRKPGEVTDTFKNSCVGCHAGQDPIANAFSYYDYDGETIDEGTMVYRDHKVMIDGSEEIVDGVAPKINLNNIYSQGRPVVNNSWINLWNRGQNKYIEWGSESSGNGAKSLGKMLSETKQVRKCMANKVFESVCYKKAVSELDKEVVSQYANDFDKDANLKKLFAKIAVYCMGSNA